MWPFRKRKWVVVSQQIQPSRLEVIRSQGIMPAQGFASDAARVLIVHYRDELSGNEKVQKINL